MIFPVGFWGGAAATLNTPALRAYWTGASAGGTTPDLGDKTGNGHQLAINTGTVTSAAQKAGGPAGSNGQAFTFPGVAGNYLTTPSATDLQTSNTTDWTWLGWINPDTTTGNPQPAGKGLFTASTAEWNCFVLTSTGHFLGVNCNANDTVQQNADSGQTLAANTWYFVVVQFDSAAQKLYAQVNMAAAGSIANATTITPGVGVMYLGFGSTGGGVWKGQICETGFWQSTTGGGGFLSQAQLALAYNGGAGRTWPLGVGSGSSLLQNLIVDWELADVSDASGGGRSLTNNNGVTFVPGQLGNAANFVATSSQSLTRADEAALRLTGKDFTVAIAFNLPDTTGHYSLFGKNTVNGAAASQEWDVYRWVDGKVYGDISNGSISKEIAAVATPAANAWHLIIYWYDTVNHVVGLQLDNATPVTASSSLVLQTLPAAVQIGHADAFATGKMQHARIWASTPGGGGVLTANQRNALWNSGNFIAYPFTGVP